MTIIQQIIRGKASGLVFGAIICVDNMGQVVLPILFLSLPRSEAFATECNLVAQWGFLGGDTERS